LRAALWQAARHGLTGELVDLGPAGMRSPVMRLAAEVLEGLFTAVEPPWRAAGDADQARDGVAAALRCGGGGRQRAVFTGGGIPALLGLLQAATIAA
jgi:carboxylate-amine ligase